MSDDRQSSDDRADQLMLESRHLSAEEFAAAHPELFFLVQRLTDVTQPQFNTDVPTKRGGGPEGGGMEVSVIPVKKSPRSPYQGRISIGRARSCDIVIRDSSVSKLHAYVVPNEDGSYSIVDVGSHNGTRVGSRILTPHVPTPLRPGDLVLFGAVAAATVDATSAYKALSKLGEGSSQG